MYKKWFMMLTCVLCAVVCGLMCYVVELFYMCVLICLKVLHGVMIGFRMVFVMSLSVKKCVMMFKDVLSWLSVFSVASLWLELIVALCFKLV